jgi:hypothetical protein
MSRAAARHAAGTGAPRPRAVARAMALALAACAAPHLGGPAAAQQLPLDLPVQLQGVSGYDDAVPTPEAVIHHRIGTRHTRPAQLVDYLRAVADASDRVTFARHGLTHQGRPLVHAIVTSPANHARLDEIRVRNLRLSDEPRAVTDADIATMPTIVYMGYSVHGNEASGSEAALLLLYHLAAGSGPAVDGVLDHAVVIIDPSLNPDGRARFVEWVNDNRGRVPTADPQDREHTSPWPGGRTNHYLFDLNRDWLPAAHPESRGRLALFHAWRPQLHTDYHEMGGAATYFFQPGEPARDNPNTPRSTIELTGAVAEYHARALDRIGALYYTREQFDDFYYGKGSTYPDVNGAVGILFEQASSRGLVAETPFGTLTYPFTIRNQLLASLSTLEAAVELRERLLRHQRDFYAGAPAFARSAPVAAYVWSMHPDRTRAQELAGLLRRHRIRVHELARVVQIDGRRFEPGQAMVVPVDQPQARLIQGMMERRTVFQDSIFYDVSSWTLPLAYGLEYAEFRGRAEPLLGPELTAVEPDGGGVIGGDAGYAYVMEWDRYYAPRALYRLLEAGIRPMAATRPFQARVAGQPREFGRGSLIIPIAGRDASPEHTADHVHTLVRRLAAEDHVVFHALDTGLAAAGPDLGSPSTISLATPRIALLAGAGTSSYEVGAAWHLLDQRMGIPVSLLDTDRVAEADLGRYDVVLMAGYRSGLGDRGEAALREWVRGGGTLVATGSSAAWAARSDWVGVTARPAPTDTAPDIPYADLRARAGAQAMGGAIFEAILDTTHPLAFGLPERLPVFRDHGTFLASVARPGAVVARYADRPLLSGYISARNLDALAGTPAVVAERLGQGRVIVLADDPAFRAFWHGTERLLLNAIFFGRQFWIPETTRTEPR